MNDKEVISCPYGQMIDFINCHAIERGLATQKNERKFDFDEVMAMR